MEQEERIKEEIIGMIKTNMEIYYNQDDSKFIKMREYIREHYEEKYKDITYEELLEMVNETLIDLIEAKYLYDFRRIE